MTEPQETFTDCRSESGITVGLIDTIITAARVLRDRDMSSEEVTEALKDLASDEDVARIIQQAQLKPVIEIWTFEDVSKDIQDLSPHGGDEDYVVIVRDEDNPVVWRLEGGSFMGDDHWTKHEYNGEIIWIGAHA